MLQSKSSSSKWLRMEFEARVFISLGIVAIICLINFVGFPHLPTNMELLGSLFGWTKKVSIATGFGLVAFLLVISVLLRMWSGTVLSSSRVMSFKIQKDVLSREGPYQLSRNPIYLADLFAMCCFAFVLSPIGLVMPILFYFHYCRLIEYEEISLEKQFGSEFHEYKKETPWFIPNLRSLKRMRTALPTFRINYDGFRHNAQYLLFIPGFLVSAFTGKLIYAILMGLPAVIDWAIIHTIIGLDPDKAGKKKEKSVTRLKQDKVFDDIIYSQCWEDPEMDRAAFQIGADDVVFSVTSGGCNTLTFLIDNPKKVIALDLSPYQNFLLEIKMAAFRVFNYEELLAFMGVEASTDRLEMYGRLRRHLSSKSREYWDGQSQKIDMGIIHSGRYEQYMRMLKKWMTLLVGKSLPKALFNCQTQQERQQLYDEKWDNIRWRIFTKIFLSRRMMTLLFTGKFFEQLDTDFSFGDHFRAKIKRAVTELPLKENYFFAYILLGQFYSREYLPAYLQRDHFEKIKSRLDRIEIVTGACETYFQSIEPDSISKFNFTNIFEWMEPDAFENLLKETIRVARDGAILTYRNLLVARSRPASLAHWIAPQEALSKQQHDADRAFIYRAYNVEKVVKGNKRVDGWKSPEKHDAVSAKSE